MTRQTMMIEVPQKELLRVNGLLRGPAHGCRRDDCFYQVEALFEGGFAMIVQAITAMDTAHGGWTQGVLFSKGADGLMVEVGCTDVGETFDGEYIVFAKGTKYAVSVVAK